MALRRYLYLPIGIRLGDCDFGSALVGGEAEVGAYLLGELAAGAHPIEEVELPRTAEERPVAPAHYREAVREEVDLPGHHAVMARPVGHRDSPAPLDLVRGARANHGPRLVQAEVTMVYEPVVPFRHVHGVEVGRNQGRPENLLKYIPLLGGSGVGHVK